MDGRDPGVADRQVNLLDLLAALNAGKRLIIGGTLLICVLAGLVSLALPNEYQGTVQMLPPKDTKQGFGFADLLSALPIPSLRLGEKGTPADLFIATLKSVTVRRQMVVDYDLQKVYGTDTAYDALGALSDRTTVDMSEEGTITIEVLDRDPQRAADIANHYVALLDSTNKRLAQTSAQERLAFIRFLLGNENAKLEAVMGRLQEFQSAHNAISIEDQARAVIGAAASMQTQAMELEIQRKGLLASGLGPNHATVKKLDQEIDLRQQALAYLRDGPQGGAGAPDVLTRANPFRLNLQENLFLPLKQIPRVAQEFATKEKDVLVQKALMQLLLQQEAEALIEANNTTSTVQVLDVARPAEEKARPRRLLIIFVAGVLSLFASISYVLGAAYVRALSAEWKRDYR